MHFLTFVPFLIPFFSRTSHPVKCLVGTRSRVNMAAGMFLFTVKLLLLFVVATRFTVVFTVRYAAPTSMNIVDKRECCWYFYNELLWYDWTSLS